MKKRLRKKLHVGEFQELAFEVHFQVADDLSDEAFDGVVDAFISQAIEANRLVCGGGGKKPEWDVFVTMDRRGSATEEHRQAVQRWLAAQPEVTAIQVGPLVDAWYPPNPPSEWDAPYDKIAKFWLDPIRLQSNRGFSRAEISRLQKLISEHHTELVEAWNEYSRG